MAAANATPVTNEPSATAGPSTNTSQPEVSTDTNQTNAPQTVVDRNLTAPAGVNLEQQLPPTEPADADSVVLAGEQLGTITKEGVDGVAILELELSSDTEHDAWLPQNGMSKGKGKREEPLSEEETNLHPEDEDLSHGDRVMLLQAQVQEAFVFQNYAPGTSLLANLTEQAANKPISERTPNGQGDHQPHAPDPRPDRRPSPHRLIQEKMLEFSTVGRNEEREVAHPIAHRVETVPIEPQDELPSSYRLHEERPLPFLDRGPPLLAEQLPRTAETNHKRETADRDPTGDKASKAKAMLESGKGCMVLANGDIIENGRLMLKDKMKQLEKSLPSLSPVLAHYLQTFKAYVPLPVFDKLWLICDQQAREGTEPPSESKLNKGGQTCEYCFTLFSHYILNTGWITLSENLKKHKEIVVELRNTMGWMVALRYCKRVREGVMRTTVGGEIVNVSKVQRTILEEVKLVCDNLGERACQSNPYSPGGTKEHLDPESGLPRLKAGGSGNTLRRTQENTGRLEAFSSGKRKSRLPPDKWEAKLKAEGKWVDWKEMKDSRGRRSDYNDRSKGGDRRDNSGEPKGKAENRSTSEYDIPIHKPHS
ncbi:uncharacterized protein MELLADRAFT_84299 [Melampsora larici-populina 98AG31]|uniref:Uncharacterized protein n=1 Tax=Melampsora larici-populina (strain 98AG31 / pathotype 3-4-7) TaxID=747676 RepID=F4RF90_MELLP|nr:uncharacterized protein MELLADRAFT_84299 [Melampsora larici-populina 98AG31]EGG08975.1 hypothetical protein MELLADRAFT_84299 [Melampsora larici-populina 98AG31]